MKTNIERDYGERLTNALRAQWSRAALEAYVALRGGGDDEADIQDLITDLLHLAVDQGVRPNWLDGLLRRAKDNFDAELEEDAKV